MLVLTRKIGETIYIDGEKIKITIAGISGNQVRLGISAPKEVSINREEVYERIKREKAQVMVDKVCDTCGVKNCTKHIFDDEYAGT